MTYHKVIGIDLGTTYSAVSLWDNENQKVIVIQNPVSQLTTVPSVVGLDPNGQVIVGTQAQNNLTMDPGNTIIEIKRLMGTYEREPNPTQNDPGVPKRVSFRGRDYLPQEISAFILMELKRMAESYIGEPIHDAVVTVPAYFREPQKGATADAAAMAKLNLKLLLNEPTAAAVCFGMDKITDDQQHIYAVYDLGGGTFDVSIISVTKGEVNVIGTGGDPKLGGGDFDDRITGYVMQQIQEKFHVDLSQDPNIWARVKREAEMRKRELSNPNATSTMLNLPFLTPQVSANIPLTRATFEALLSSDPDLLRRSLDCLDEAIDSAYKSNGIAREDIEQVLLVGGSTRVACIRKMIADHMGMDPSDVRADINPDEVVSRGAAILATKYRPSDGYEGKEVPIDMSKASSDEVATATSVAAAIVLNDVTSHTLGIMVNEGDFFPLIPKDSQIPARKEQDGFTNGGPTPSIDVMIFQGENPKALDNTLIGKLPIAGLEARERGYYQFQVTFSLDANGLLNVAVKSLKDGKDWATQVQCNVRASREDINNSAKELAAAMASGSQGADESGSAVMPGSIPPPPRPTVPPPPRPVASPAPQPVQPSTPTQSAPSASGAAASELSQPPADLPEKYQGIARRVFKFLNQLESSNPNYRKLSKAYNAFLGAVASGDPDIEDYYEDMKDLYERSKFG